MSRAASIDERSKLLVVVAHQIADSLLSTHCGQSRKAGAPERDRPLGYQTEGVGTGS